MRRRRGPLELAATQQRWFATAVQDYAEFGRSLSAAPDSLFPADGVAAAPAAGAAGQDSSDAT